MSYNFSTNFNTVEPKTFGNQLIERGTFAKTVFNMNRGGVGPDGLFTKSETTGSIYINGVFTIMEGPHAKRKIFQCIVVESGNDNKWGKQGMAFLRKVLESGRNIDPNDTSEIAYKQRNLNSFAELDGLICAICIGVERPKNDNFEPKNTVSDVITPHHKMYKTIMNGDSLTTPVWAIR